MSVKLAGQLVYVNTITPASAERVFGGAVRRRLATLESLTSGGLADSLSALFRSLGERKKQKEGNMPPARKKKGRGRRRVKRKRGRVL